MAYSAKTTGLQNRLVAQHEYVHSIMAASGAVYPRWYSEGLADMLGAIYIKDGRVVIGGEIVGRIKRLSAGDVYVPLSRIISKEDIWNWNVYLASFFTQCLGRLSITCTRGDWSEKMIMVKTYLNT